MMEVIPINTNEHAALKADLWAERIRAFQESGLSRKDWCQQNEIPQSTLSYWIRKIRAADTGTECFAEPVFAKLPSEQNLQVNAIAGNESVRNLVSLEAHASLDKTSICRNLLLILGIFCCRIFLLLLV